MSNIDDWRYHINRLENCKTEEERIKVIDQLMELSPNDQKGQGCIELDRTKYNYE